jgi:hypothetical protein
MGASVGAAAREPFCQAGIATGLTIGTAYWLDLALGRVGGIGTDQASISNLTGAVTEM